MALVMAKTDPNAPRHKQYSTFIVELPNPGYKIKRNVTNMAIEGPHDDEHPRRPFRDRDQGSEGAGRQSARRRGQRLQHGPAPPRLRPAAPRHAQHRQGPARARHGGRRMSPSARPSACCSPTARPCSSCSPTAPSELYIGRLMLLHIAYKAEKGMDLTAGELDRQGLSGAHGAQGDRHRDPAPRRARLQPGYVAGQSGTPRSARSGWSTAPTKCTNGRSAATSSRRSASTAPRRRPRAAICFERTVSLPGLTRRNRILFRNARED